MSKQTRNEYLKTMRYRSLRYTGKVAKTRLLDEFCEVTGHGRKYATKLLGGRRGPAPPAPPESQRGAQKAGAGPG